MAATATHDKELAHVAEDEVFHQFEDLEQQNESYIVGMWTFLVTEVMFFGPLFFAYMLYRWQYQPEWYLIHKALDWKLGGVNTVILLLSSFTMALAVYNAQLKRRKQQLICLTITMLCAFGFLIVKTFEWVPKFQHHLVPGGTFSWQGWVDNTGPNVPDSVAAMFFSLYFAMTGLHGIHVVIGIICIGLLMFLTVKNHRNTESYIPTEMVGLYWHFVDLVWIFLYPLFYLMPQ